MSGFRLHLTLLGGFQARWASGAQIEFPNRKTQGLLAYLVLPAGKAQSRERLMGLLWSDRAEPQARNSLRQALAELNRALGSAEPSPLVKEQDRVALDLASVDVDAMAFERLAASDKVEELRRAVALYAGDLLEGIGIRDPAFEEWLLVERQRLRDLAVTALRKLLGRETGHEAIASARRLLALDPLQEDGHRALMRLHAKAGEIGAALRQYETCRETLKRELGVGPSPETEALHQQIRDQPVKSNGRSVDDSAPVSAFTHKQGVPPGGSKPSIAVLPFVNMSGDLEQQYLSDGITEDIITELSRYRQLLVIARNSSFQYRDKSIDMRRVGQELGVQYLVEGSLRKDGNSIRLTAQLIEVASGGHLWAQRYERDLKGIFAIQDEMAQTIAATLVGEVERAHAGRVRRRPTESWAAYDYFLQGMACLSRYDLDGVVTLMNRAVQVDPLYARAYALLSTAYILKFFADYSERTLNTALRYAEQALSIDDNDDFTQAAMGQVQGFLSHWDLARMHIDKAASLNPNSVLIAAMAALWLIRVGRAPEALQTLDTALQRDPLQPPWYWEIRGMALLQEKRYGEVIQAINHKSSLQSWDHATLAMAHAYLGHDSDASKEATIAVRMQPNFSIAGWAKTDPYLNPAHLEHIVEGLRKAGLPE